MSKRGRKPIDWTGKKVGRLTCLRDTGHVRGNCRVWQCRCECGNLHEVPSNQLTLGTKSSKGTRSCGCLMIDLLKARVNRDRVDEVLDRVTNGETLKDVADSWGVSRQAVEQKVRHMTSEQQQAYKEAVWKPGRHASDIKGRRFGKLTAVEMVGLGNCKAALWRCECDCGGEKIVTTSNLNSGSVKSCGCLPGGPRPSEEVAERNDSIVALRNGGMKLGDLADLFGVSAGLIWQITTNYKGRFR